MSTRSLELDSCRSITSTATSYEMPRTSEVLWDGTSSLPFVLKRKRNGAILVTKIKERRFPTSQLDLRLGSELKLVGGFPVQQLTLAEVKKVMLHAPKPVSLLFLNHDDVILDNMSFLSEDRGSFENEHDYDYEYDYDNDPTITSHDNMYPPTLRESSEWTDTPPKTQTVPYSTFPSTRRQSFYDSVAHGSSFSMMEEPASPLHHTTGSMSTTSTSRRRRRSPEHAVSQTAPPRKVSKLKQALERMNELLNRPVRRSGLNVAAGKSIVV